MKTLEKTTGDKLVSYLLYISLAIGCILMLCGLISAFAGLSAYPVAFAPGIITMFLGSVFVAFSLSALAEI